MAKEEITYYDRLKGKIQEFQEKTGGHEPSVIIVTPAFWFYFVEEFLHSGKELSPVTEFDQQNNSFRGHKIIRSDDVLDDDILVY